MSVEVRLSVQAKRSIEDMDGSVRERLTDALAGIEPERDLAALQGTDALKYRIGEYRAICDYDRAENSVYVLAVGHRSTVYDRVDLG